MEPQTMAVIHWIWTEAKARETIVIDFQSHSPTPASLKSLGAAMVRQRKSRQKSSSMKGTTRDAPSQRMMMKAHMAAAEEKNLSGMKTSALGFGYLGQMWRRSCSMPTHWMTPMMPTMTPSHQ